MPAEPTALENALAETADRLLDVGPRSVGLARALVSRLTRRALDDGDVAACRELLRLVSEAEATACERAQLAAEREEAEALAAEADRAAEAAAAEAEARRVQARARAELEALAEDAACDHGVDGLAGADARALGLLDAVETDPDKDRPAAVRPWVVEAARGHDPALPLGGDDRPIELDDPDDALIRLRVARLGYNPGTVPGWFIDAALARRPERKLAKGEAAMLALVRQDDDAWPPDWAERLAAVEASLVPEDTTKNAPGFPEALSYPE